MTFVPEIARTLRQDPGGVGNAWNTTYVPEVSHTLTSRGESAAANTQEDTFIAVPEVAAPLTRGSSSGQGVNEPGRRQEDDSNVIAFYPGEARMAGESWDDVSPTLKVGSGLGISSPPAIAFFSENQRAEVRETDFAFSLTNGGGKPGQGYPAVRVGAAVRRLTPRECERLQGFPDDWTALGADNKRYAALGDAVTVPVAEWIGRRLMEVNDGS